MHHHLALAAGVADHRRRIIRKHARHRRQVADIAIDHAKQAMMAAWLVVIEYRLHITNISGVRALISPEGCDFGEVLFGGSEMLGALVILSLLSLTGCFVFASPEQLAQEDDSACRSYGAVPGTAPYINCRMQRDNTRQQGEAMRRAAIIMSPN